VFLGAAHDRRPSRGCSARLLDGEQILIRMCRQSTAGATHPASWKTGLVLLLVLTCTSQISGATQYETALNAGLAALRAGDLPSARQNLEQASLMPEAGAMVWLALAETYRRLPDPEQAEQAAAKALQMGPNDPRVLQGLATYQAALGRWAEAASMAERSARLLPQSGDAVQTAVGLYLRAEQPEQASALAQWGLEQNDSTDLRLLLVQAHLAGGNAKLAVEVLERAIQLQPYEERPYFELARLQMSLQDFEGSLATIARGEKIFSKSPQLELLRGIAFYGQRRFSEAVDAFLRSAELGLKMEQPHAFLGRILSHAHDRLDRVTARFAAFAAATPESYLSQYLYAAALLEGMGPSLDPATAAKAEALLQRSLELKEDFADSHFEFGVLLAKKREFEGAEKHLQRSVELNPKSSKAHYHLSRVYARLGKQEQAERERSLHEKLTEDERQAMRSGMAPETQPALSGMIR